METWGWGSAASACLPVLHKDFGFIRGNHDSPDMCRIHPNYAGDHGMWNGVYVIGGAYSIDWSHRTPGESWWPGEEQSIEDLARVKEEYLDLKPEIVASHECPTMVGQMLLRDGGFRPEKWGSTESRTAQTMQSMFARYQPKFWVFGHYHRNWGAVVEGTRFQCLNELSVAEF